MLDPRGERQSTPRPPRRRRRLLIVLGLAAVGLALWFNRRHPTGLSEQPAARPVALPTAMVTLPAGEFIMGADLGGFADQRPAHVVAIPSFQLDGTPVTNRQFARFVQQTGHVTTAQRRGWSLVFDTEAAAWRRVDQADWQHPSGPNSSIAGRQHYPVVQVSWFDASAYAAWAGKRLPTEAEYEYAARGGLADCDYPWGRELKPGGSCQANFWQGWFPLADAAQDGFAGLSPVDAFPPNRYGLHDMAGNVRCWCADWYAPDYYARNENFAPTGPIRGEHRVRRGGSWLSAANYGDALKVAYRDHAPPDEATNHTGFRCAASTDRTAVQRASRRE